MPLRGCRARVASGSHGEPSSSSATQKLNLPGCPRVERSIPPGRTSNRLMRTRRIARPMTAVARSLLPSALNVPSIARARRTAPLTTMKMAQPPVLAVAPCRVNSSRSMAASAVTTGEVHRQATGHHRVDGDLFRGDRPDAHRFHPDNVFRRQGGALETRPHRGLGGRHDGQTVRPAALVEEFLGGEDAVRFVNCGPEVHGWGRCARHLPDCPHREHAGGAIALPSGEIRASGRRWESQLASQSRHWQVWVTSSTEGRLGHPATGIEVRAGLEYTRNADVSALTAR